MVEHRAPERMPGRASPERVLAGAAPDRNDELPGRNGGYERMVAEARRPAGAAVQAATSAAAEEIGASVTRLMQETTRGMRAAMLLPVAPGAGFGEMQQAFTEMLAGMMRNNIRLAQEVLRIYGPQDNLDLMQRIMRHWSDAALQHQSAMLRLMQPVSSEASHPGEKAVKRPGTSTH